MAHSLARFSSASSHDVLESKPGSAEPETTTPVMQTPS